MNQDVMVKIIGRQLNVEEEPVVTTAPGIYHFTNEKHYIQYDEKQEDSEAISRNTLKISQTEIVLTKKGLLHSQMAFDLKGETQVDYQTPYGSLILEIKTKSIEINEESDKIEIKLNYTLSSNASLLSDNELSIVIKDKN